jgi:hypothetical protein
MREKRLTNLRPITRTQPPIKYVFSLLEASQDWTKIISILNIPPIYKRPCRETKEIDSKMRENNPTYSAINQFYSIIKKRY